MHHGCQQASHISQVAVIVRQLSRSDDAGQFVRQDAGNLAGNASSTGAVHSHRHGVLCGSPLDVHRGVAIGIHIEGDGATRVQLRHQLVEQQVLTLHWGVLGSIPILRGLGQNLGSVLAGLSIGIHTIHLTVLGHVHVVVANEHANLAHLAHVLHWAIQRG